MTNKTKNRTPSTPGPKPFVPKEEDIIKAEAIATQAFSYGAIAARFGMSVDTLARVREEYPDFSDALKRGKLKAVEVKNQKDAPGKYLAAVPLISHTRPLSSGSSGMLAMKPTSGRS
jgi:hypothetical protein